MARSRILRLLRIAASAVSLILCVAFVVLWMRSYRSFDLVRGHFLGATNFGVVLQDAELWVDFFTPSRYAPRWVWFPGHVSPPNKNAYAQLEIDEWRYPSVVPLWFPVALSCTLAVAPWIDWQKRFSLRTLLLAMTLVVIVLALAVALR
jgi:hypothetical protein